jgi:hypothetical protein
VVSEKVVYEGRWVPTSNWSTEERGALRGVDGFGSRALEYIWVI